MKSETNLDQYDVAFLEYLKGIESMPDINPRVMARLEDAWSVESGQAGSTVWALYNALTRWSTHAEVRPSAAHNRAAIVLDRESRVDQVIRGQAFRRLAV